MPRLGCAVLAGAVSFGSTYDIDAAISWADANCASGSSQCAEFVSDSLKAGGFNDCWTTWAPDLDKCLQGKGWQKHDWPGPKGSVVVYVDAEGPYHVALARDDNGHTDQHNANHCDMNGDWDMPEVGSGYHYALAPPGGPGPSPSPAPSPPSPPSSTYPIRFRGDGNKCLDLPGGDTRHGNQIWLWDCNGMTSQTWSWEDGNIKYGGDESQCLDIPGGSFDYGNKIQLWFCNGSPAQVFGYDQSMGTIYLANSADEDASACLDLPGGSTSNGNMLWIWGCNGYQNQQWLVGYGDDAVVA